jgi:hypothetical protein
MSIPAGNCATGAPGTGPALGYILNLFWFNSLFMLISENNMNTCTYLIHTLSLIMKLIVIFGIKIYRKLPIILTEINHKSLNLILWFMQPQCTVSLQKCHSRISHAAIDGFPHFFLERINVHEQVTTSFFNTVQKGRKTGRFHRI